MDTQSLTAEPRKIMGRKVKILRKEGNLPVNVYGKKIKSTAFSVKLSDFLDVYKKVGETSLVNLVVSGAKGKKPERAVLVSNVQIDPVSDKPIHVDFRQVDLKEKVTADVPVELVGESPAEKTSVGTVVQYIDKISVEALPKELPDKFIIDISKLAEVDQSVLIKDLKVDPGVKILVDASSIVIKVEPPQKEEVVAPTPTEAAPTEGVVAPEGGEQPPAEAGGETPAPQAPKEEKPTS